LGGKKEKGKNLDKKRFFPLIGKVKIDGKNN